VAKRDETFRCYGDGKSVVGAIRDIGESLDDRDWIAEPGNSQQLALAVENVFMHPYKARKKSRQSSEEISKEPQHGYRGKKN
jgi:hypothetical protein